MPITHHQTHNLKLKTLFPTPHPPHPTPRFMSPEIVEILSPEELRRTVNRLASQIVERAGDLSELVLLGIYTRGAHLALLLGRQIEALEQISVPVGAIDITFYRDDLDTIGLRTPAKTEIPFDLSGQNRGAGG
ncbi:hypothetical protein [Kovacikia minuta]